MRSLSFIFIFFITYASPAQPAQWRQADSVAEMYSGHSLSDLSLLSYKLTNTLSGEAAKFRSIYRWVCLNIKGNDDLDQIVKKKRSTLTPGEFAEWNKGFSRKVIRTLIDGKITVCSGYAWLLKELSLRAGITCEIVDGYGRSTKSNIGGSGFANHSWNAVKLDGQWYLCDATWSSGFIVSETRFFVSSYSDNYFMTEPSLFVRNHYPLDTTWTLLNNPPDLKTFLNAPLVYASTFEYEVAPYQPATYKVEIGRGETISFNIAAKDPGLFRRLRLVVDASYVGDEATSANVFDHTFSRKGVHKVQLVVDGKFVVGYEVTVK